MFFFFNDTATTEIYTLSLHDALPILTVSKQSPVRTHAGPQTLHLQVWVDGPRRAHRTSGPELARRVQRSEEHTSELQSRQYLVCRLLLEKKKIHICARPTATYCIAIL